MPDEHIGYLAGGWLTMGQVLSLPMILVGVALLDLRLPRPRSAPATSHCAVTRAMKPYLELMRHIRERGARKDDRTGTGTLSLFGAAAALRSGAGLSAGHDQEDPPALGRSTSCCGSCAARPTSPGCASTASRIWDEWADERGELGPVYGKQWRAWLAPDGRTHRSDRAGAWSSCARNPDSRRILVSAWNVGELERMALMPCHALFQFYVADGRLSCQLYQRSADVFLGVPFNIASYALLTHMFAQQCDLEPGELVWTGGDCHLYLNHLEQADLQLARAPLPLPRLRHPAPAAEHLSTMTTRISNS